MTRAGAYFANQLTLRSVFTLFGGIVASILVLSSAAAAEAGSDVEMIVSRGDDAVEVYFAMPAEVAVAHFGLTADDLTNADGFADFDLFSQGTWDLGEKFRQGLSAEIDGKTISLEAMSLMLHPKKLSLPFETPLDAMISIEVCGVEETGISLSDSHLYVGLIAFTDDDDGTLSLTLPAGSGVIDVTARDFMDHRFVQTASVAGDENQLVLAASDGGGDNSWISGGKIGFLSIVLAGLAFVATRGQTAFTA